MAFTLQGFQFNRGVVTSNSQGEGITSVTHSYKSNDTIAQITTLGYFPPSIDGTTDKIFVGDLVNIIASDSTNIRKVLALNPFTLDVDLYFHQIVDHFTTTFVNDTSVSNSVTFVITKIGPFVCIGIIGFVVTATTSAHPTPTYSSTVALPVQYRPINTAGGEMHIAKNGVGQTSLFTILPNGIMNVYSNPQQAQNWPASTPISFAPGSISYFVI